MSNVISLKDFKVQRLRHQHPAFKNTKFLARGSFCGVYSMLQPDRVLKLTVDSCHIAYLTDGCAPTGIHKPELLKDYGPVGTTEDGLDLYLVEVEKLYPVRRGTENGLLAHRIVRFVDRSGRYPQGLEDIPGLTPSLVEFMTLLNQFIGNYGCHSDARLANFMEREDGTLVLSDPVFDRELFLKNPRSTQAPCIWRQAA